MVTALAKGRRAIKEAVWKRDGVKCRYCGVQLRIPPRGVPSSDPLDATVDHIKPRAHGGSFYHRNLLTACRPCNMAKGARDALEFRLSQETKTPAD